MYQKLVKGLAVYRQKHTKSIYVRLRVNGQDIQKSLKTSDLDEAISKAWALKFETEGMIKAGLPILKTKKMTVLSACKSVIEQLEQKKQSKPIFKDYILIYNNFIIPYFKNKTIDDLTTKNIRIYFESLELSKTRKTINKTCFNKLFLFLEEEELLKKKNFPTLPKDLKTKKTNIGFDISKTDLKTIKDFIVSEEWLNQKNINFKTKEYRMMFPHVFNFLLETGVRTGEEMNGIRFSDIQKHNRLFTITITKGKTKDYSQREIMLSNSSIDSLISIVEITHNIKIDRDRLLRFKDDFVFESSFKKIADWCKLFDQIIKSLSFSISKKYTLYSCRHTYISNKLLKGVDPYIISKQVGNSLEMIQKHYDHIILKDNKNSKSLIDDKDFMVRF